jgi:hypothetical protein
MSVCLTRTDRASCCKCVKVKPTRYALRLRPCTLAVARLRRLLTQMVTVALFTYIPIFDEVLV